MENEPEGSPKADDAQQPPAPPIIPEGKAPGRQATATESESKADPAEKQLDRDLVNWTRMLAFFTGALVLAAALQFWALRGQLDEMRTTRESSDKWMTAQLKVMGDQTKAMQGQLDEMKAEQRPWVSVTIEDQPIVTIAPKKSTVSLTFTIKNVGHSVALGATADYSADGEYNGIGIPITDPCAQPGRFNIRDSRTLFPGEVYTTRRYGLLFGGWVLADTHVPTGPPIPTLVVKVSGCVTYTYEGSPIKHHTPFIYRLYGSEYSPGIPIGFPLMAYGDITSMVKPVHVYIPGVDPD